MRTASIARSANLLRHGAGQHRPRLRDRIDAALVVLRRAQRRAVVVVAAPVPLAVPGRARARRRAAAPPAGSDRRAARSSRRIADRRKRGEDGVQEEAEPRALAAALRPDAVHPVVPVAAADQRQPVRADGQALVDRANAMFEERAVFGRTRRAARRRSAGPASSGGASRNGMRSSSTRGVAGCRHVLGDDERQPQQIVGATRSQAAAARLVPPVLHVAFAELTAGGAQDVRARQIRTRRATAPSRPAVDRGIRRRRPAGSSRSAPRAGSSRPDRAASD